MTGQTTIRGRAWVFGDDIDTDVLAPGLYMKGGIEALAAHCLESVRPDFAANASPGDILIAGRNFGIGSSREQAAQALKHLGIAAILARSFGGIFYRNALNFGLPAFTCDGLGMIADGATVELDLKAGRLQETTGGATVSFDPLPGHLAEMVAAGGLVPHLKKRLAARADG